MPRIRDDHRVRCHGEQWQVASASGRVVLEICEECGYRIRVDGRAVAVHGGPFDSDRLRRDAADAARAVAAVPAAELRLIASIDSA